MIRPPARNGVAFSEGSDGDMRRNHSARSAISEALGLSDAWATVRQVHGGEVLRADAPGEAGEADALWTTEPDLPLTVFTADCFGVVLHADEAVGVAHAGWRGADAGVVVNLRRQMAAGGHEPRRAEIGPGIGPCCFEVGPEVAERFADVTGETDWGTDSVDLPAAILRQLEDLDVWSATACTYHEGRWLSYRREGTSERLATIGWLS